MGRQMAHRTGVDRWFRNQPTTCEFRAPHHERVPTLIDDLIRFAQRTDIDPLAKALLAHARFETIHPFPDGNGRTGRALIHAMLRRDRLTRNVTVPVSSGLLTEIDRYFDALGAYRNGDPNPIIEIGAHASLEAIDNDANSPRKCVRQEPCGPNVPAVSAVTRWHGK